MNDHERILCRPQLFLTAWSNNSSLKVVVRPSVCPTDRHRFLSRFLISSCDTNQVISLKVYLPKTEIIPNRWLSVTFPIVKIFFLFFIHMKPNYANEILEINNFLSFFTVALYILVVKCKGLILNTSMYMQ